MARGLNKVMVIGNLGGDPQLRYTPNGKAVANMSLAAATRWGQVEHTEWVSVVAWGGLAEVCGRHLAKAARCTWRVG